MPPAASVASMCRIQCDTMIHFSLSASSEPAVWKQIVTPYLNCCSWRYNSTGSTSGSHHQPTVAQWCVCNSQLRPATLHNTLSSGFHCKQMAPSAVRFAPHWSRARDPGQQCTKEEWLPYCQLIRSLPLTLIDNRNVDRSVADFMRPLRLFIVYSRTNGFLQSLWFMARPLCGCPLVQDVDTEPVVGVPTAEREGSLHKASLDAAFPTCYFDVPPVFFFFFFIISHRKRCYWVTCSGKCSLLKYFNTLQGFSFIRGFIAGCKL